MLEFRHLHTHTTFTAGNSTLEVDELVRRAAELGMDATAIVDSGTIEGFDEFTRACAEHGVEPIYGCGFYLAKGPRRAPEGRTHLVLLVKNQTGMEKLEQLVERSFAEGFHGKPHIDDELLRLHHDGLVCLTGGLGGDVDKLIVSGQLEHARKRARFYRSVFGEDFYLELQDHGRERNRIALTGLDRLSHELRIPTVVTQGAFYLDRADASRCNALRETHANKPLAGCEYYFKSATEMHALFAGNPAALETTGILAEQLLGWGK